MSWVAVGLIVLGIGFAFGCCCNCAKCLECDDSDIDASAIDLTISGIVNGTCNKCTNFNGTFHLTYDNGLSSADHTSCYWNGDFFTDHCGVCTDEQHRIEFRITCQADGLRANWTVYATDYSSPAVPCSGFFPSAGHTPEPFDGQLSCSEVGLDVSSSLGWTNCDVSAIVATVDVV